MWQHWCRDQTSLHHLLIFSLAIVSLICCRPGLRGFIFHLIFPLNFPYFYLISHQTSLALSSSCHSQFDHCIVSLICWHPNLRLGGTIIRSLFGPELLFAYMPSNQYLFSCKNSCNENSNRHCALNQHIFKNIISYLYFCVLVFLSFKSA